MRVLYPAFSSWACFQGSTTWEHWSVLRSLLLPSKTPLSRYFSFYPFTWPSSGGYLDHPQAPPSISLCGCLLSAFQHLKFPFLFICIIYCLFFESWSYTSRINYAAARCPWALRLRKLFHKNSAQRTGVGRTLQIHSSPTYPAPPLKINN